MIFSSPSAAADPMPSEDQQQPSSLKSTKMTPPTADGSIKDVSASACPYHQPNTADGVTAATNADSPANTWRNLLQKPTSPVVDTTESTEWNGGESACPMAAARGCSSESSTAATSIDGSSPLLFIDPENKEATSALPSRRQVSSIPRTMPSPDNSNSESSLSGDTYWVYPSQQQFYEAMKRKNYDPKEEDMVLLLFCILFVTIHASGRVGPTAQYRQ
jgi:cytochrome c heme-lyase